MVLADKFGSILESLPGDWTGLEVDLKIDDLGNYVDAALIVAQANGQPYAEGEWQWHFSVANTFGHAASTATVHGVLRQLDSAAIGGELRLKDVREGRSEVVQMWGRPESVREEFRRRNLI